VNVKMFKDFTFCQFNGTCQEVVTNISKVFIYEKLTKEWNSNSNCVIGVLFHRNQKWLEKFSVICSKCTITWG